MSINQTQRTDAYASRARVIAFFNDRDDAYRAISRLREAGFTSTEIGLMASDDSQTTVGSRQTAKHESFWDKLKDFFTGDSHDDLDYRDTSTDMNWDQSRADYYYRGIGAGGALVSVTGTRVEEARRILEDAGGDLRESGFESVPDTSHLGSTNDVRRIQLRGEMLRTYKERVQRGEVRFRKDVITETQNVQVPVTREELVIERVPASGESPAGDIGTETDEIRVPLSEERVRAEKQPIVTEEVRVGKRATQSTENVSENLRHEELRVEKEGDVNVDSEALRSGKRPKKPAA